MNYPVLVKKSSTCQSLKFEVDYLDETSESKRAYLGNEKVWVHKRGSDGEVYWRSAKNVGGDNKEPIRDMMHSLDYLSKEDAGQVHIKGFLREIISDQEGRAIETLDNESRKKLINKAWLDQLRAMGIRYKTTAHKLVISMDRKVSDELLANGLHPDKVLFSVMERTLKNFQKKFHEGAQLSYAYGFHHDTDNLHVHIALFPIDSQGKYVGMSNQLKGRTPNGQADKLGYFKNESMEQFLGLKDRLIQGLQSEKKENILEQYGLRPVVAEPPEVEKVSEVVKDAIAAAEKTLKEKNMFREDAIPGLAEDQVLEQLEKKWRKAISEYERKGELKVANHADLEKVVDAAARSQVEFNKHKNRLKDLYVDREKVFMAMADSRRVGFFRTMAIGMLGTGALKAARAVMKQNRAELRLRYKEVKNAIVEEKKRGPQLAYNLCCGKEALHIAKCLLHGRLPEVKISKEEYQVALNISTVKPAD